MLMHDGHRGDLRAEWRQSSTVNVVDCTILYGVETTVSLIQCQLTVVHASRPMIPIFHIKPARVSPEKIEHPRPRPNSDVRAATNNTPQERRA